VAAKAQQKLEAKDAQVAPAAAAVGDACAGSSAEAEAGPASKGEGVEEAVGKP